MYNKEEREQQLRKMRAVSKDFYFQATHTGCHAFIEFCGLMEKFIDVCDKSSKAGVDFNESNTHTGGELLVQEHDIAYLAEKFDCIFGPTLADPKRRAFFFECMGWQPPKLLIEAAERVIKEASTDGDLPPASPLVDALYGLARTTKEIQSERRKVCREKT